MSSRQITYAASAVAWLLLLGGFRAAWAGPSPAESQRQLIVYARVIDQYQESLERDDINEFLAREDSLTTPTRLDTNIQGRNLNKELAINVSSLPQSASCAILALGLKKPELFFDPAPVKVCRDSTHVTFTVYRRLLTFRVETSSADSTKLSGTRVRVLKAAAKVSCDDFGCKVEIDRKEKQRTDTYELRVSRRGIPAVSAKYVETDATDPTLSVPLEMPNRWLGLRAAYFRSLSPFALSGFGAALEFNQMMLELAPETRPGLTLTLLGGLHVYAGQVMETLATLPGLQPLSVSRSTQAFLLEGSGGLTVPLGERVYLHYFVTLHFAPELQNTHAMEDGSSLPSKTLFGGGLGTRVDLRFELARYVYLVTAVGYRHAWFKSLSQSEFNYFGNRRYGGEGGDVGKFEFSAGVVFRF